MPRGAGAVDAAGAGAGLGPGSRTLGTRSSWCSRPTTGSSKVCLPLARRPPAPCEPCCPSPPACSCAHRPTRARRRRVDEAAAGGLRRLAAQASCGAGLRLRGALGTSPSWLSAPQAVRGPRRGRRLAPPCFCAPQAVRSARRSAWREWRPHGRARACVSVIFWTCPRGGCVVSSVRCRCRLPLVSRCISKLSKFSRCSRVRRVAPGPDHAQASTSQ